MSGDTIEVRIKKAQLDAPQFTRFEFAAWLNSGGIDAFSMIDMVIPDSSTPVKKFIIAISNAEKAFSRSALQFITKNNSETGFIASVFRYFSYVWIDATATSAVVGAMYTMSIKHTHLDSSRFNSLYPILVTLVGTPLKAILVAAAIPSLAVLAVVGGTLAVVDQVASRMGYSDRFKNSWNQLTSISSSLLGLVATVAISNINPVFLLKTLFVDPILCARTITRNNAKVKYPHNFSSDGGMANRNNIPLPTNVNRDAIATVQVTFTSSIRNDIFASLAGEFGYGYIFTKKLSKWDPLNFVRKDLEFEICQSGKKIIIATAQLKKINSGNIIELKFTENASDDDKHRVAAGFKAMVDKITKKIKSEIPDIKITNCSIADSVFDPKPPPPRASDLNIA